MLRFAPTVLALLCLASITANAQDSNGGGQQPKDSMSYSYVQVNHLAVKSDFFNDRPGSENLTGFGVGTHQAYNDTTSFFVDLGYYRDALSASLGSRKDNYWRVTYGFRGMLTSYLELDGAIFAERNTDFGRRPFGERLGLGLKSQYIGLMFSGEHTANGNRAEVSLSWFYR